MHLKTFLLFVFAFVVCVALSGCTKEKPAGPDPTLASLPQLPDADLAKLSGMEGKPVLVTTGVFRAPEPPPPPPGAIEPKCAKDDMETDYSGKVLYGVWVCGIGGTTGIPTGVITTSSPLKPSYSIDYARLSADQRGIIGTQPTGGVFCSLDRGPWNADIKSEHACSGTCDVQNVMDLTNAPKLVELHWTGAVNQPPPGVEYVGRLSSSGTIDNGPCHPDTQPHGR